MADMNDHCMHCGEYHYMGMACDRRPNPVVAALNLQASELKDTVSALRNELESVSRVAYQPHECVCGRTWTLACSIDIDAGKEGE